MTVQTDAIKFSWMWECRACGSMVEYVDLVRVSEILMITVLDPKKIFTKGERLQCSCKSRDLKYVDVGVEKVELQVKTQEKKKEVQN